MRKYILFNFCCKYFGELRSVQNTHLMAFFAFYFLDLFYFLNKY